MKPHRSANYSTDTLYKRSLRIWELFFLSLPLEALVSQYVKPIFSSGFALQLAIVATIVIFPFLSSNLLGAILSRFRANQQLAKISGNTRAAGWVLGFITVSLLIKVFAMVGEAGLAQSNFNSEKAMSWIIPISIGALLIIGLLYGSLRHLAREWREDQNKIQKQDFAQIKKWEEQLLILSSLPMLLARGIAFLGSITEELPNSSQVSFWLTGAALLLLLRPQRNTFIGACARCRQPVPIVMTELGQCGNCRSKRH